MNEDEIDATPRPDHGDQGKATTGEGGNGEGSGEDANPLAANTVESAASEDGNNLANDPASDPLWNPSLEPDDPGPGA
jgi:hypothetical protein